MAMPLRLGASRGHSLRTREMRRVAIAPASRTFLDALGERRTQSLLAGAGARVHDTASAVVREGRTPSGIVVVLSGRVKVVAAAAAANRDVMLALRGPGELACGLEALHGGAPCASAIALEPVESATLSREDVVALCAGDPEAALALAQYLATRLTDEQRLRLQDAALDTTGRVASRLVELAERFGRREPAGLRIDVPLSQEELAGWASASHKALTTALQRLRHMGCIETGRRTLLVRDLEALRELTR